MIFIYKIRTVVVVLYMYTIHEIVKNRAGDTKIPCPIVLHTYPRKHKPKDFDYLINDIIKISHGYYCPKCGTEIVIDD